MESCEILREAVGKVGVKSVAADMNLSTSLLYKWCERNPQDNCSPNNPLERVAELYELTGDAAIVSWLCQKAGGFFAINPAASANNNKAAIRAIRLILKKFTDVLDTASESIEDDGQISPSEAEEIRKEWEELKAVTEGFVENCEKGTYMDKTVDNA